MKVTGKSSIRYKIKWNILWCCNSTAEKSPVLFSGTFSKSLLASDCYFECYFMFKRFHLFVNWCHTNSNISSRVARTISVQAQLLPNERLLCDQGQIRFEDFSPRENIIMDKDHIQSKNNRRTV